MKVPSQGLFEIIKRGSCGIDVRKLSLQFQQARVVTGLRGIMQLIRVFRNPFSGGVFNSAALFKAGVFSMANLTRARPKGESRSKSFWFAVVNVVKKSDGAGVIGLFQSETAEVVVRRPEIPVELSAWA